MGKDYIFCMNCGQKLPAEAKFCFACGQRVETGSYQNAAEDAPKPAPCRQEDMGRPAETGGTLTLAEFRAQAPSRTGFREQLLAYRKSLPHNWDYNAFVGILLGAAERSAARLTAQQNYAVGQGDNGKNATHTIEMRGLTAVYEKYKGKNISPSILLSDVEEEIISAVPDYAAIRDKFHEIVFAGAGGKGKAAARPHQSAAGAAPAAEDIPHAAPAAAKTKPAAAETKSAAVEAKPATAAPTAAETDDASEIIDFFVEVLAYRVLAYVTGDTTIDRADIREKFGKWKHEIWKNQQEFEVRFGTSPEAKWLYSADGFARNAINLDLNITRPLAPNWYEIDKVVSLLQKLPEGKYGIAYYALAKCYGVGIDTIIRDCGEKGRIYILRPNFREMLRYLEMAADAQRPEKEALVDLGCIELSLGRFQNAKAIFEEAKGRGAQKAPIYLRYIECCEHAVPAINGQRTTNDDKKQHIYGNIVEYKDRVYWMCEDRQNKEPLRTTILLCSLGADGKRTVLASMQSDTSRSAASEMGLAFSICNDLIYYENGSGGICTMRLDGSDKRELTDLSNNGKTRVFMPMAFPGFLLYTRGSDCQLWKRDQFGVKTKIRKLNSRISIVGVSEREINIENTELIDLRTLEKQKVTQKYPALKGKTVFYIDMAREIAYYEDHTDTGNYKDRRLIGVNTRGEIVDYWEMPLMPYDHDPMDGHISFCFNGHRLSFKMDMVDGAIRRKYKYPAISAEEYMELWKKQGLSEREWPYVALFDRRGNRLLLHMRKKDDPRMVFGSFHMMTKNGVIILENHGERELSYWDTYYPIFKGAIPPAKLDFFH